MDVDLNGATWRKSRLYSNGTGGNCVEVADLPSGLGLVVQGIQAGELSR